MDLRNEQAVLGSFLVSDREFPKAAAQLTVGDFHEPRNRAVWRAMLTLHRDGTHLDPVTVLEQMKQDGLQNVPAARAYLWELMDVTPTSANAMVYVEDLCRESARTKLTQLGEKLRSESPSGVPMELMNQARRELDALSGRFTSSSVSDFNDLLADFLDWRSAVEDGKSLSVATGIPQLDEIYGGGLMRSGLHILAARPGVGKTALALNIAANAAKAGKAVLFVSLEMSRNQLMARILARFSRVNSGILVSGEKYTEPQWVQVSEAGADLNGLPLSICDKDNASLTYIEAAARSIPDLALIVVDYLGLLPPSNPRQNIYERVTENSRSLKQLALKLDLPLLCICQLNREAARNNRPTMADLRDSGHIEQDADTITLLSRIEAQSDEETDCLLADVVKNRHGRQGETYLWFHKAFCAVLEGAASFREKAQRR